MYGSDIFTSSISSKENILLVTNQSSNFLLMFNSDLSNLHKKLNKTDVTFLQHCVCVV